jgi:RNA polymerase sigma-70 factor, ECF subfamily
MGLIPATSTNELALSRLRAHARADKPSEVERVVISLFDQCRTPLLRYVLSLGLSVHDGEEVTQEVFLALARHLQLGKSQRNLRGWLFRVAHNLGLKRRHATQRPQNHLDWHGSLAEKQPDSAPNPEEQLLSAQRRQRLVAVLNALPEQDQMCLRLRAEGLRYREIARVVGISLGSVSISLSRSLARLMCADER